MSNILNRRQFPRFMLQPMYAPISVRTEPGTGGKRSPIEGHAYDISEGGVRFEVDDKLTVGASIGMQITLPTTGAELGPGRSIMVFATVAWVEEDDEHPPFRCAAKFTGFARLGDRERLVKAFTAGRMKRVE